MAVYTDSLAYAADLLSQDAAGSLAPLAAPDPSTAPLAEALFVEGRPLWHSPGGGSPWTHLFLSEFSPGSQYDQLIGLARSRLPLPDRIASAAGSGLGFHGFKGRPWAAAPGNVHLSVHLAPHRPVERFEVAFTALAALSVVDALDALPGLEGRTGIKWVNDILLEGAKVAGILAYTQTRDTTVTSAILGIGLNVETAPRVEPTPFVPRVGCLRQFARGESCEGGMPPAVRQGPVLLALLEALDRNYRLLLGEGFGPLLERYRDRSLVVGREVCLCAEDSGEELRVLAEGRAVALGEGLELYLEGCPDPLRGGRLILGGSPPLEMAAAADLRTRDHTDT